MDGLKSNASGEEFKLNEVGNYIVTLFGGMNGWGEWIEYLDDFSRLLKGLHKNNISGYIVDINIDALDDVFSITIELRDLKELTKENSASEFVLSIYNENNIQYDIWTISS